jgi:bacteriocin-like protein
MKEFQQITADELTQVEGGDDSSAIYYVQAMVALWKLGLAISYGKGGAPHSNLIGPFPTGHKPEMMVAHLH